jgi:hypothetical protein
MRPLHGTGVVYFAKGRCLHAAQRSACTLKRLKHKGLIGQVRHIIAGTAARTMAQAFIHPIDTVKTRLQVVFLVERGMLEQEQCH